MNNPDIRTQVAASAAATYLEALYRMAAAELNLGRSSRPEVLDRVRREREQIPAEAWKFADQFLAAEKERRHVAVTRG